MTGTAGPAAGPVGPGAEGPPLVLGPVSRTDIVRYAGASGDFTAIHHDEVAARAAGHPTVFAMGLYLGGVMARTVVDWFGRAALRSYEVRFRRPVWPDDRVTITARVAGIDPDGVGTVEIEAVDPEGVVRATAVATVATNSSTASTGS